MRAIVVGSGEVGFHTAERLSAEGHDVTLVEGNRERLREVEERLNVLGLHGNGAQAETLEEAGIRSCDVFIAVTDVDEVNVVACLLAREYGARTKIARVKSLGYTSTQAVLNAEKLGIDLLINPLEAVASDLVRIAEHAAAVEVAEFADGRILFVGYPIGSENPVCGLSLSDLKDLRDMYPFLVTAITRAGKTLVPRGGDVIEPGDHVFMVMRSGDLPSIRYLLGFEKRQVRRVFVLGGGEVGFRVAQRLEARKLDVRIADPDRSLCARLAERLDRAVVLQSEITDVQALAGEGLGEADVVLATSESEETNILAALLAKRQGARRALCVVNRPAYVSLVPSLGIDACVSPRLSTASAILRYVRRGGIVSIATVEENDAEVVELLIEPSVGWLGQPLKSLSFPSGALLGAVVRGADAIIPTGDTVLQAGDRAVVFALPQAIVQVEEFFGVE
jgi:trk system potassium uptake protein TrkA